MANLYVLIIALFALSGLGVAIWSWSHISKARKRSNWLMVKGTVVEMISSEKSKDMTPRVKYTYGVDEKTYNGVLVLANSDVVLPELATENDAKYPIGSEIDVFYDPANAEDSTPEPDVKKDDWFIFWLSTGALVTGILYILFNV